MMKAVSILVTNPNPVDLTVSLRGSGYSQGETGGLGLGLSPDYRVSREWILDQPDSVSGATTLATARGAVLWTKPANDNQEIDGRFVIESSGPIYVYVVVTSGGLLAQALAVTQAQPMLDAPGDYRVSGAPPPPFGREAGVYAADTWISSFDVMLPASGAAHVAFMVNTATGVGLSQIQAFGALGHYAESAAEAVGMYGNVYDLDVGLVASAHAVGTTRVRVAFHSLATANLSRLWDGAALVDGLVRDVRHIPGAETTTLLDATLSPGELRRLRFRAMVPGLTSIPQAFTVEVF
jgi:hypothetical protein